MNRKQALQYILLLAVCFAAGCAVSLAIRLYDARTDAIVPIQGGQTVDMSRYGFTLCAPEGARLADYTANNYAEGGHAQFAGCIYMDRRELYLFCYDNPAGDDIAQIEPQELFTHYLSAGAKDVRLRAIGERRFIEYSALVEHDGVLETWYTYETWDPVRQITFETRMPPEEALPVIATIAFTD